MPADAASGSAAPMEALPVDATAAPAAADQAPAPMDVSPPEAATSTEARPVTTDTQATQAVSSPPKELPGLKVTFYELLIRQLQDDGFVPEAASLSQQLKIEPNDRVERDALLEAYGKSLKWAFGDAPQGQWVPINGTPVPPIGPQERVLDFVDGVPTGAGESATANPPTGPLGSGAIGDQFGQDSGKKPPELRLLYTAQHKQACRALTFSNDGRHCATGCADGSIKILDCARMRMCAASSEGPLGRVRITEEELMKPIIRTLQDHVLGITCLAFHPMNPTLFSGSADKAVKIFDLTRPPGHKKAFSVLQDVHPVRCLSIHPCGDFLLVGTAHQAIRLYDLQTLNCFTTYHQDHHHADGINDVRCSSDGRIFASASSDGAIFVWDAVSQRVVNRLPKAHSGSAVTSLRWSRNQKYLLSSGSDGRCRLWDVRQGQELFSMGFGPRNCEFSSAVFAAGERYVVSSNSNIRFSDVSLFDAQTGSPVFMKLGMHLMPVQALDASPVDRTLMTGCDDDKARYFSIEERAGA